MNYLRALHEHPEPIFVSLGIIVGSIVIGLLLQAMLTRLAQRQRARSLLTSILEILKTHVMIWSVVAGVAFSLRVFPLSLRAEILADRLSAALVILLLTAVAAHIAKEVIPRIASRLNFPLPAASLSQNLVQVVVYVFGALLLLSNFGIAIGPFLTALGVGSLAVGLALQDTLSNLFAGFYLLASRQVEIGDYLELERGIGYGTHKGYIMDMGWRSSRMKTLSGQIVLIPNSFITQSYIVSFREKGELQIPVEFQFDGKTDLAQAEQRLLNAATEVFRRFSVPNPDKRAIVRFTTGREPILATVLLRTATDTDQSLIQHEFLKKAKTELSREPTAV